MDTVANCPAFSTQDKKLINCCRLYLQVVTLANISDIAGTCIQTDMLMGTYLLRGSDMDVHIFNQVKPGPKVWTFWRKALQPHHWKTQLHAPLGA